MMFLMGYVLYIIAIISYFFVDTIGELINNAFLLAEGITSIIFSIYIYPLCIATYQMIKRKNDDSNFRFLSKQTTLAASIAVSMGLIGTFLGLTQMISAIASSTTGSDNISEQMNMLMSGISSALSAMAYAFLTSILGVTVSVLLLVSLNFWSFFYDKKTSGKGNSLKETNDHNKKIEQLIDINLNLHKQLLNQKKTEDYWTKIINSIEAIHKKQEQDRATIISSASEISKSLKSVSESNSEIVKNLTVLAENQSSKQNQIITQLQEINEKNNIIISLHENSNRRVDKGFIRLEKILLNINKYQKGIKRSLCLQSIYVRKVVRDSNKERARIKDCLKAISK